jgi:hypothetical protein
MRRILHGFVLLSWIAFTASVTVSGLGFSRFSLLQELQFVLMAMPLGFEAARAVLTGVIVATLSAMLWATMIAVTSAANEHRERVMALGVGFSAVLAVSAVSMIAAAFTGLPTATATLFAVQMATLLSMLAAGGVEFAWEVRSPASAPEPEADGFADRVSRQLAASSASLAAVTAASRDCGEPI